MSIFSIKKSINNISRYREIIGVLIKYGFEDILNQLHADAALRKIKSPFMKREQAPAADISRARRVRLAMEELGPTFIKLGQMLSTRYDLLPLEYLDELRKLQDDVQPFESEKSIAIIEDETQAGIDDLFSDFTVEPMAAASIAQVHRAVTNEGEKVVVKVQRPDIAEIIETDVRIFRELALLIEKHIPESHVFDPTGLVDQFKAWIGEELNFLQEGRSVNRFKKNFADDETVFVPGVYWDLTTEKILTIEYVEGIYIDRLDQLDKAGMDRRKIARNGTIFVFRQMFDFHFFHGDPHPSNLLVLENNVIAPLDYGLMGRLDEVLAGDVGDLLYGIVKNDASMIVRTLMYLNRLNTDVDRESLRIDVSDLLARYHSVPLHMLKFERFFNDLVTVIRNNKIQFPRNLYLMGKAQMMMESIAQKLDPEYNIISIAKAFFTPRVLGRAEAEKFLRNSALMLEDYADLMVQAPRTLLQILKKARWGEMGVNLHHVRIDDMLNEIDRSANRLSFSMIIASLVVGSSLIVQLDKGPKVWDLPVFGVIGYLLAAFLGLWLVFSILRSGRLK